MWGPVRFYGRLTLMMMIMIFFNTQSKHILNKRFQLPGFVLRIAMIYKNNRKWMNDLLLFLLLFLN